MAATAKVILVRFDHNTATNDGVRTNQLHQSVLDVHVGNARLVSLDVSKITHHALLIIRSTVVAAKRVEDATGSHEALGEIAEDVNVKTVLAL